MRCVRLICLPYAGAGAGVFRSWQRGLPDWLQVTPLHLPGREEQIGEAAIQNWPALIETLLCEVRPHVETPFAIFGHSMGALVGFELAHALWTRCGVEPLLFVASGSAAPARRKLDANWLDCPDERLIAEVRRLGGTPQALLDDAEFMQMILPCIRADFHLCGSYAYRPRKPIAAPLLAMVGAEDRVAQRMQDVAAWADEFSGASRVMKMSGAHFFINEQRAGVLAAIVDALAGETPRIESRRAC